MPTSRDLLTDSAGEALPERDLVLAGVRTRTLGRGETVFAAGDGLASVFLVTSGIIKLFYVDRNGDEMVKSFCPEGRVFSCLSALDTNRPATFTAAALEKAEIEILPFRPMAELARIHVGWSQFLAGAFRAFAAAKELREYELLCLTPEQRYRHFIAREPVLAGRLKQKDLAAFLGLTPVGLNRIIRRIGAGPEAPERSALTAGDHAGRSGDSASDRASDRKRHEPRSL